MKQPQDDIVLVRGNNRLDVQLTPLPKDEFYVPALMATRITDGTILGMYWNHRCWVDITNRGTVAGTHRIHWWDNISNYDEEFDLTLQPGETYKFSHWQWIDYINHNYRVFLEGDWVGNNYSEAIF